MRIVNKFVIKCRKKYPAENIFRGISYLLRIIQACPNICQRNILRLPPPLLIYALSTFSAFSALPNTALEGSPVTVGTPFIEASVFRDCPPVR